MSTYNKPQLLFNNNQECIYMMMNKITNLNKEKIKC